MTKPQKRELFKTKIIFIVRIKDETKKGNVKIHNAKSRTHLIIMSGAFLLYRKFHKIWTHETVFAQRRSAKWVKRLASFFKKIL